MNEGNPMMMGENMQEAEAIDEVSPDQEEADSQNQFQYQKQMQSIPGA